MSAGVVILLWSINLAMIAGIALAIARPTAWRASVEAAGIGLGAAFLIAAGVALICLWVTLTIICVVGGAVAYGVWRLVGACTGARRA